MAERPRDVGRRRNAELERTWRERIAVWEASGLTARAYCREHELKENAFYVWRRELRRRDGQAAAAVDGSQPSAELRKPPPFVTVNVPTTHAEAPIEIVLPDGVLVRVSGRADHATIAGVLGALREARAC